MISRTPLGIICKSTKGIPPNTLDKHRLKGITRIFKAVSKRKRTTPPSSRAEPSRRILGRGDPGVPGDGHGLAVAAVPADEEADVSRSSCRRVQLKSSAVELTSNRSKTRPWLRMSILEAFFSAQNEWPWLFQNANRKSSLRGGRGYLGELVWVGSSYCPQEVVGYLALEHDGRHVSHAWGRRRPVLAVPLAPPRIPTLQTVGQMRAVR